MNSIEIEERREAFNAAWRRRYVGTVSRMPAHLQQEVHELLRNAFNAGTNWERRKQDVVCVGGMD